MCVYVDTGTFSLLQKFFKIFQVMSTDKDTRIVSNTNVYFGDFRISVMAGIGSIELGHSLHTMVTRSECEGYQFVHSNIFAGQFSQSILHECKYLRILIS